jgi:D-sedoheptulose 7-phosphate isomerase
VESQESQIQQVAQMFMRSAEVKQQVAGSRLCESLVTMGNVATEKILAGGKIMFCGNGGSAADAQHLAAELLVRLRSSVNRQGLPALALTMDTSTMTACANDYSYEDLYARMVDTLGGNHDVLVGITTSGNSESVLKALKAAQLKNITTIGFLGGDGGPALPLCDHHFLVPCSETARIQESHITAGHALIELIEDNLKQKGYLQLN